MIKKKRQDKKDKTSESGRSCFVLISLYLLYHRYAVVGLDWMVVCFEENLIA